MVQSQYLIGIAIALGGTFFLALQNLLLRMGTDEGRVYDGILIVLLTNVGVLLPLVSVVYYPDYGVTVLTLGAFVAAGVTGTLLARAMKYVSISQIGASRTEPISMANALVATILGVLFLGEEVTFFHLLAVCVIILGIALISWETTRKNPHDLSRKQLALGMMFPLGAALFYGIEPIFASYGLQRGTPAPVAVVLKSTAALIGFAFFLYVGGRRPTFSTVRRADARLFFYAGVANTIFVLGYYVALELAPVSIVSPILPTSTLLTVLLAALFMPRRLEQITGRLILAACLVVAGVVALSIVA